MSYYLLSVVCDNGFYGGSLNNYPKIEKILGNFRRHFGEFDYLDRGLDKDYFGRKYAIDNKLDITNISDNNVKPCFTSSTIDVRSKAENVIKTLGSRRLNTKLANMLLYPGKSSYLIIFYDGKSLSTIELMDKIARLKGRVQMIVYDFNLDCLFSNCYNG